jgi:ElaB/YqjD/DUF883 family membrane-anchored ribosome-binding protein
MPTLCAEAQRVADKFLAENPDALLKHKLEVATKEVKYAQANIDEAIDTLKRRNKEYKAAVLKLTAAEAQFRKAGGK